jgi:hypothetical protein
MEMNAASMNEADIGGSGYSLDDLAGYLERGRTPAIAAIDDNPACQAMLASLERMTALSRELVETDASTGPPLDEAWLGSLLSTIGRELHAGRDLPFSSADPDTRLSITEGAVRELVRAAGDSVTGVLVGSVSIDGAIEGAVSVSLTVSVVLRAPIVALAQAVRERVHSELLKHTELAVESIDVTVVDVHLLTTEIEDEK